MSKFSENSFKSEIIIVLMYLFIKRYIKTMGNNQDKEKRPSKLNTKSNSSKKKASLVFEQKLSDVDLEFLSSQCKL